MQKTDKFTNRMSTGHYQTNYQGGKWGRILDKYMTLTIHKNKYKLLSRKKEKLKKNKTLGFPSMIFQFQFLILDYS